MNSRKTGNYYYLQLACFGFSLKLVIGGALVRCSNGNRGISSVMYDYINDIHYLLPRLNDLAHGIKKEPFTKSEWLLYSLKKGTSHSIILY